MIDTLQVGIVDWKGWAQGLQSLGEWEHWASNHSDIPDSEEKLKADRVPRSHARRASRLTKRSLEVALELLEVHDVDYLVFASRHGEITTSYGLLESMIFEKEISPMKFAQSVHNASSGLLTIIKGSQVASTTISAGKDSFQMAMVEASSFLKLNPDKKVLLLYFDTELPQPYKQYVDEKDPEFALGLVLTASGDGMVQASFSGVDSAVQTVDPAEPKDPQALHFLRSLLNKTTPKVVLQGELHDWSWTVG